MATPRGVAWGNVDGTDWYDLSGQVGVYLDRLSADGRWVIVTKTGDDPGTLYRLDLETGRLSPVMSARGAPTSIGNPALSPDGHHMYRLVIQETGANLLQMVDMQIGQYYSLTLRTSTSPAVVWL